RVHGEALPRALDPARRAGGPPRGRLRPHGLAGGGRAGAQIATGPGGERRVKSALRVLRLSARASGRKPPGARPISSWRFPMKIVLAVLVLAALAQGVRPAHAAVGDIVALVRADRLAPGPGLDAGTSRRLVPDAHLDATLTSLGYARVSALGAATDNGLQPMRLVRLSPTEG